MRIMAWRVIIWSGANLRCMNKYQRMKCSLEFLPDFISKICSGVCLSFLTSKLSHLTTKPTKWHVCPAKTQISLGIHPVRAKSSLSAWWKLGSLATHWAHREDWSDWADAQADLSLLWVHMPLCWFRHEAAQINDTPQESEKFGTPRKLL